MKRFLHIAVALSIVSSSGPAIARSPVAEEFAIGVIEKLCLETDFSVSRIRAASSSERNQKETVVDRELKVTFDTQLGTRQQPSTLVVSWNAETPDSAEMCSIAFSGQMNGELLMLAFFTKLDVDPSGFVNGENEANLFTKGQFQSRGRSIVLTSIIGRSAGDHNNDTILLMFRPAEKVS
jgi:hypothetical protein